MGQILTFNILVNPLCVLKEQIEFLQIYKCNKDENKALELF